MTGKSVPVVVLAGGMAKPEVQAAGWPALRALAPVAGRPMVAWVLDALRAANGVREIVVVGPDELSAVIGDAALLPVGEGMWDNIAAGLRHFPDERVLLSSSDVPLLTPAAVDDVIGRGMEIDADFVYPIIRKEQNEAQCPGLSRTYGTLVEGTFTGGNLILVHSTRLLASDELIRKALAARKKPLELARLINLRLVLKVMLKRARISELETQVTRVLGATARALETTYAEIGADLDSPEETPIIEGLMAKRRG
ncbi:MAG TPA: nucleotidyltransferase family protein [Armatimonadota bacterium]|jgi:molybdopterin-guanine dinucleotide biosynthesis protein A